MATRVRVVRNVAEIPAQTVYGSGAYTDLLASTNGDSPVVAGVWNLQDVTEFTAAEESGWDEVKYVLQGSIALHDHVTGEELEANAGDFIWLPKGSKASITRSSNLTAIYFEQREADWPNGSNESPGGHTFRLKQQLDELIEWFQESNPKSALAAAEAADVLPGGNTRTVLHSLPFPLTLESGQDTSVTSKDGFQYTDFVSEYTCGIFGHSHPGIHEAISEALRTGINLGGMTGKESEMGRLIRRRFPSMELMRFTNSGTEANTLALSAALAHSGRRKILVFSNGYHGSTLSFPVGEKPRTNLPYQFVVGTYNDIEVTRQSLHYDIGAIIVEPLQSAGGVVPATREFLQFLREAATTLNVVLIFDEVVTSRLHYHGMQGLHGITPDVTTLGKWIGGGFSFGCFGGKRTIMEQFDPSKSTFLAHSGTFNNNVFTMTAGIAGLNIVSAEEIARLNAMGDRLRVGFNQTVSDSGLTDWIGAQGLGSIVGIKVSGATGRVLKDILYFGMLKRQIVMGRRGFVALNLMHTDAHIDRFLEAARQIFLITSPVSK